MITTAMLQEALDNVSDIRDINKVFSLYDEYTRQDNGFHSKLKALDILSVALELEKEMLG